MFRCRSFGRIPTYNFLFVLYVTKLYLGLQVPGSTEVEVSLFLIHSFSPEMLPVPLSYFNILCLPWNYLLLCSHMQTFFYDLKDFHQITPQPCAQENEVHT